MFFVMSLRLSDQQFWDLDESSEGSDLAGLIPSQQRASLRLAKSGGSIVEPDTCLTEAW